MKNTHTTMEGLSGVDAMDLDTEGLDALLQPRLPLRETNGEDGCNLTINVNHHHPPRRPLPRRNLKAKKTTRKTEGRKNFKSGIVVSPFAKSMEPKFFKGKRASKMKPIRSGSGPFIKTLLVLGIGYGTYKLFGSSIPQKAKQKRK